jgi:ABC-type Mn2+/Zn2+ transport system ATPase subunit
MTRFPAIRTEALTVGYDGESVVSDIGITLESGCILALVGSNGSGKTTLLRTLAGLLAPVSGTLDLLGEGPEVRPGRLSYLGQFHPTSFMLPLRVIDVVRMARFANRGLFGTLTAEDERTVLGAMEQMGILELRREPLNALSGGQRQRVFLAQAFAREADLLLMDEPAANLDAAGRETYRRLVHEAANRGCTVVVATHDIDEAAEYDQTMLLAHRVVAYGRAEDILTTEALLSTFGIVGRYREGRVVVLEREHGCCGDGDPEHDHSRHAKERGPAR